MPAIAAKKMPFFGRVSLREGLELFLSPPASMERAMPLRVTIMPRMASGRMVSPRKSHPVRAAVGAERVMKSWPKREPI